MARLTLDIWISRTERYIQIAALIFLIAYACPIVAPSIPNTMKTVCTVVVIVTWVAFGVDYVVRLALAEHRSRWFLKNLPSLIILIIPVLRPLRLLRLVTLITVLNRASIRSLRERVAVYTVGGVILLMLCGALAVTEAERGHIESRIYDFGDGLWWAFVTITTVGYGDTHPVTITGRIVAVCLMIGGIALLGTVSGMLASWMVESIKAPASHIEPNSTTSKLEELMSLKDAGIVTQEEFDTKKTKILESM